MSYTIIISQKITHNKGYSHVWDRYSINVDTLEAAIRCAERYANGQYLHKWNTASRYEGPLAEIIDCSTGERAER